MLAMLDKISDGAESKIVGPLPSIASTKAGRFRRSIVRTLTPNQVASYTLCDLIGATLFHADSRPHPGMNAALELMQSGSEAGELDGRAWSERNCTRWCALR